jgi:hypothetical protein
MNCVQKRHFLQTISFKLIRFQLKRVISITKAYEMSDKQIEDNSKSIHSSQINEVYEVPIHVIIRPIPPELDESKVNSLMETLRVSI